MLRCAYLCLWQVPCFVCHRNFGKKQLPETWGSKNSEMSVSTLGCFEICSKTWSILIVQELTARLLFCLWNAGSKRSTSSRQLWIQPKLKSCFHQRAALALVGFFRQPPGHKYILDQIQKGVRKKSESLPLEMCSLGLWSNARVSGTIHCYSDLLCKSD